MSRGLKRRAAAALVLAALSVLAVAPARAQSLPEGIEAIDRARVATRILYVTAHPDDESSSVLTYLARGLHADVALLSITRGEGGQNALGPEQAPQLGLLRTEELLAATRAYGVRLYFTRAPDFGFSKTTEETLRVWGDTALDDMVRVIRTFRPHVVINNWGGVHSGHGHHQTAGLLTPKAVEAAGDPRAFPQQLAEGLAEWKPALVLQLARGEAADGYRLPLDEISPLWGKSYRGLGLEGFANHRTQGVAAFLGSPFLRRPISLVTADSAKLDPARLAEPLAALTLNGQPVMPLEGADRALRQARSAALGMEWAEVVRDLVVAGKLIAERQGQVGRQAANQAAAGELDAERRKIDAALALATGLRIEANADRSEIVAGESFTVRAGVRRRAELPGDYGKPTLVLPSGWSLTQEDADPSGTPRFAVAIPKGTAVPGAPNAWMLPEPPPLVQAQVHAVVDGYGFDVAAPVMAERATSTRVDTLPLTLVPAVTLVLEPQQFIVIEKQPAPQLEVLARVHSYATSAAKVTVSLETPQGWRASPAQTLEFPGAGDQLVRFTVTPPAEVTGGDYRLKAYARRGEEAFQTSLEPLPTLPTRLWSEPAVAAVHAFDVSVPQGLRVGYVAAENDPIPEALRRLGIRVDLLDPVTLAFGDLNRYDAIAIGIRAYELRSDLERANQRLLDYAAAGGTLVVQYQRDSVWDRLKPAPYPATIVQALARPPSAGAAPGDARGKEATPSVAPPGVVRITDENSPVRFLLPGDPLLNFPNKITQDDFRGWVQERGLYFWKQFDPRYQAVLGMRDPGELEATGGLVYARTGKGVYIYTGLAFFRQLPEGVPGAYRLFVNLLSQSKLENRK